MVRNKEMSVYGLILAGSGISQFVAGLLSDNPSELVEHAGIGILGIGLFIFLLGFFWKRDPSKKPLGILVLALGLGVVGLLIVAVGGWFFTPLFFLAFVCFALMYGLLTKKSWGLYGLLMFTLIGSFASLAGIGNAGIVNVAGVLSSCYLFWYLDREHVAEYFKTEPMMPRLSRSGLVMLLILVLLFSLPIGYLQYNPSSSQVASGGISGNGGSGSSPFTFHKDDRVNFSFQVTSGYPPLKVTIQRGEEYGSGVLATETGMSSSMIVTIPSTGMYTIWYEPTNGIYGFDYEVTVTFYSWRRIIPQWALLDAYSVIAVLSAILTTNRAAPHKQKPYVTQETENNVDQQTARAGLSWLTCSRTCSV